MKRKLLIVSILLSMLLCINVKAKTFLPDEVDTSTYIVGTHMFTMDGSDVYDGVFEKITIIDTDKDKKIYSNLLEGTSKARKTVSDIWNGIINWFIKNI